MNKKHLLLIAYSIIVVLVVPFTSCTDDTEESNATSVKNKITINMMKGSYENATKIGPLYINNNLRFSFYNDNGEIATIGNVKNLESISGFPSYGYIDYADVVKGYGYVCGCYDYKANYENSYKTYRLFVDDEIKDNRGDIVGYKVSVDTTFYGKNQEIKLPSKVAFGNTGGKDTLVFSDLEPMVVEYKSSENWCIINKLGVLSQPYNWPSPCVIGLVIKAYASDTIGVSTATINIKTKYGKKKTIKVTRAAAEPKIELQYEEEKNINLPANGGDYLIKPISTIPVDKLETINTASDWCKTSLYEVHNSGVYDGKYLRLEAKSNDSGKERSGTITLKYKYGNECLTINVKQEIPYIKCEYDIDKPYIMEYNSDYTRLIFNSNIYDLKAESSVDWINYVEINRYFGYEKTQHELGYSTEENNSGVDREGIITISDNNGRHTLPIKIILKKH